ncbi:MAG: UDP-N-acetylglucosamine 1-carboxyvinyltransferase [Eubacteriales bacterium]|nr:UDP-N-acetylglucosamine 1-carboxyvinyltransferase [Eubacteriales bacterium]
MMKILVKKSTPLSGEIKACGSKNAALPIMAATLLCGGKCTLTDIPELADTINMKNIMRELGCKISGDCFDSSCVYSTSAPYEWVKKLRGSFLLAAPLLARLGRAQIPLPGGCPIGTRPIDLHLKGFSALGAEVDRYHGVVDLKCKKLKGGKIYLDFPSVGATENLIMAAVLADGETLIENAAAEPEVVDLCEFLQKQGAVIEGVGGNTIRIEGVSSLSGTEHRIIPDRIEAGTYITAFAITHGKGRVKNVRVEHQKPLAAKLTEMGVKVSEDNGDFLIDARGDIYSSNIKTLPYPGFPTDMQAQITSLLSVANGTGMVVETVFENRFLHIGELTRMGAMIRMDGRTSVIEGVKRLTGAKVEAHDLRGGAALALAGLVADGETEISDAWHIARGYENFCEKMQGAGANICIVNE